MACHYVFQFQSWCFLLFSVQASRKAVSCGLYWCSCETPSLTGFRIISLSCHLRQVISLFLSRPIGGGPPFACRSSKVRVDVTVLQAKLFGRYQIAFYTAECKHRAFRRRTLFSNCCAYAAESLSHDTGLAL